MEFWHYRRLEEGELRRLVEQSPWCRLGLAVGGQPYVVPIHFRAEWQEGGPVLRMTSPAYGLKIQCLEADRRVAVEFDRRGEDWAESAVGFGFARFAPVPGPPPLLEIKVNLYQLTGRRYDIKKTP